MSARDDASRAAFLRWARAVSPLQGRNHGAWAAWQEAVAWERERVDAMQDTLSAAGDTTSKLRTAYSTRGEV